MKIMLVDVFHLLGVLFCGLNSVSSWILPLNAHIVRRRPSPLLSSKSSPPTLEVNIVEPFMTQLRDTLLKLELTSMTLSNPRASLASNADFPGCEPDIQSISGRYIQLKQETKYQLSYKYKTNDKVKNHDLCDVTTIINGIVKSGVFKTLGFTTASQDRHKVDIKLPPGKISKPHYRHKIEKVRPKPTTGSADMTAGEIDMRHDRVKNVFIPIEAPFLEELGITYQERAKKIKGNTNVGNDNRVTTQPVVRARVGMTDKLGQIQKYVEILDGLVKSTPDLVARTGKGLNIVDMGSGLAYLTFATHLHFRQSFPDLQTLGVERRADLSNRTNAIARKLGSDFEGLHFHAASISSVKRISGESVERDCENTLDFSEATPVDVLMALHACDTATDDAILYGIKNNASVIVVSPCCHKEVRRQMEDYHAQITSSKHTQHPLAEVLAHGIYRERQAEMITDTIRALCLQCMGYDTKVFEFISGDRTAKNTMIAATRHEAPLEGVSKETLKKKMRDLMQLFGIRSQQLVAMLDLELGK